MTIHYLRDDARVELALAATMLYELVGSCIAYRLEVDPHRPDDEKAHDDALQSALKAAAWEPLDGLHGKATAKVCRRVLRAKELAIGEHRETDDRPGADMMKVFQMVRYWVARLVELEYLVVYEGSAFATAWELLAQDVEDEKNEARINAVAPSAWKQARKMHERLQAAGYFTTATWED